MKNKKLEKLEALMKLSLDSISKEESLEFFKNLTNYVKRIEAQNVKDFQDIKKTIDLVKANISKESNLTNAEVKAIVKQETENMSGNFKTLSKKINDVLMEVRNGEDGKDADEEEIIERVKEQIVIPEIQDLAESIPQLGEPIRDALELLQDDDRLDASAIKGLKQLIEELTPQRMGGGGGFSKIAMDFHFVDEEDLTGTKNGVNKVFTVNGVVSPANSLKVYKNGQRLRLTTDYTFAGNTITLVTAPESDELLYADYRT